MDCLLCGCLRHRWCWNFGQLGQSCSADAAKSERGDVRLSARYCLILCGLRLLTVIPATISGLAVSNLCVLISALPALFDMSSGLGGGETWALSSSIIKISLINCGPVLGHYTTAFFQAHLMLPLINSFMASSVYIIICMTVNRYISIYKPTDFQRLHTQKNARASISLSFFFGIIFHIPLCFQNKVVKYCGSPPGKLFHFLILHFNLNIFPTSEISQK